MRTVAMAIALAACSASYTDIARDAERANRRALAASNARISRLGSETQVAVRSVAPPSWPSAGPTTNVIAAAGTHGLAGDEYIVAAPDHDALLFVEGASCVRGDACRCDASLAYHVVHDGPRVIVVRQVPVIRDREVHVAGTCETGCGVQARPEVSPPRGEALDLGTDELSNVEIRQELYPVVVVRETCDYPRARP